MLRNILIGAKKIFRWIVKSVEYSIILWNDQDFDYVYILTMLKYKIYRTKKHIHKHNILSNADKYVRQMMVAERMIQDIVDDNFCNNKIDRHYKKWGRPTLRSGVGITGKNAITSEQIRQERREADKIYSLANKMREDRWRELFKYLRRHMNKWWD